MKLSTTTLLAAVLVGCLAALFKLDVAAASRIRGAVGVEPIPAWSRQEPNAKQAMLILEAKLKKLGCKLKCTRGARILTQEKSDAAKLFLKFVARAHAVVNEPTNATLAHTKAVKEDVLFYVSDVWKKLAQFDAEASVERYGAIADSLDFEMRIRSLMKIVKEGPNHFERGLVGGPYANTKCMSGVALAGAKDPTNGAPLCIPVMGHVVPRVQCANFDMIPGSVLKTLSTAEFEKMCAGAGDCQYLDYEQNGNVGVCVPRTSSNATLGGKARKTQKLWQRVWQMRKRMQAKLVVPAGAHAAEIANNATKAAVGDTAKAEETEAALAAQMAVLAARSNVTGLNASSKAGIRKEIQTLVLKEARLNPESAHNKEVRKDCQRMHDARMVALEKLSLTIKDKRFECRGLKNGWKAEPAQKVDCSDCQPPRSPPKSRNTYFECEKSIIRLLVLKKRISQDLSECSKTLHNYRCDVLYTKNQCPPKPFCQEEQVDFFKRMAAGTKGDCCNTYTCIQRGFGGNAFSSGMALRPMKTKSVCPDYSSVSSLEALRKYKLDGAVLGWYEKLCVKVEGCMYLKETNTCV